MSAYRKNFDETKYVSFFIKDDKFLENYIDIWENREFDSNPVYNKKYLKTKIKLCQR